MHNIENHDNSIGMIGAGPVGSLLAIYLARRGFTSEIYERRPDMRREKIAAGKSINLAVSTRGLHALRQVGLEDEILKMAIPMYGRMIHSPTGQLTFQRYGKDDSECIHSISRSGLNCALMTLAEKTGRVAIRFEEKITGVDLDAGQIQIEHEVSGAEATHQYSTLIATDGSSSVIRHEMMKRPGYECTQDYLDYGYKELTIPVGPNGGFRIERNALHIWPRGTFMLIALPNFDGSFTCTLFLPSQGPDSFETLGENPERILAFFQKHFADVIPLLTDPVETFNANPTGHMVTVKCFPWHVADRALLLGDAAHAIVPFFGQGMNCGFEDCTIFDELLEKHGKLNSQFFAQFSQLRKPHTDGIADMAIENFVEMRDKVGDTRFLMEKSVEKILQQHFPTEYISRYALVTFSRLPYRVAYEAGIVESEILGELCRNIKQAEEVDLDQAARLIRAKLNPVLQHQKGLNHGS